MSIFFCDGLDFKFSKSLEKFGAKIIPLTLSIDSENTKTNLLINNNYDEFYSMLEREENIKLIPQSSSDYINLFEPYLKNGEEIIYCHYSSKLFPSMYALRLAKENLLKKYPNVKLTIINSNNFSTAYALICLEVVKLVNKGETTQTIISFINANKNNFVSNFIINKTEFLLNNSRVKHENLISNKILNVKPVLGINKKGEFEVLDKPVGIKKAINSVMNNLQKKGENVNDYPVIITHSNNEKFANELREKVVEYLGKEANIIVENMSPYTCMFCGLNSIEITYHCKNI